MQEPTLRKERCFHRSHTHLVGALTPLVIGELVKDPEKRWRWIRICSVLGIAVNELWMSWRERVSRDREQQPGLPAASHNATRATEGSVGRIGLVRRPR